MRNTIKKAIFPALVFTHILVRFCMADGTEIKTDRGIDRANRVTALMTEIKEEKKSLKEEQQIDFLAVAAVND